MPVNLVPAGLRYNRESVERALDLHAREGRIRHWRPNYGTAGHVITTSPGDALVTRTLRETMLVAQGLASAAQAAGTAGNHGIPDRAGSPAMPVISAIADGGDYIALVRTDGAGPGSFATVRAYPAGDGRWLATAGHYGFATAAEAARDMAQRAGIPVVLSGLSYPHAVRLLMADPFWLEGGEATRLCGRAVRREETGRVPRWASAGSASVRARGSGGVFTYDIRDER
jgi:hypothetical protein